jgi:hypothetical protein
MDPNQVNNFRYNNLLTPNSNQNFSDIALSGLATKEHGSEMKVIEMMDDQRFNTSSHNISLRSNKDIVEEDKH